MFPKFKYTAQDVDCEYCLYRANHRCSIGLVCPFIPERIEAGVLSYKDVLCYTFRGVSIRFAARLGFLVGTFPGSFWCDCEHYYRFEALCSMAVVPLCSDNNRLYAALYLLSANREIFKRSLDCFKWRYVHLGRIRLRGISQEDYVFAQAAKTLLNRESKITVEDMEDTELVDADSFRLVINAILIARYGLDISKLNY